MRNLLLHGYTLVLSLWIGGITIFTFIVTPVIFRDFERDVAGKIVGTLFPGYFFYNLVLSILACALLFVIYGAFSKTGFRASLVLVVLAIVFNLFVAYKLHPEIVKVKQEIHSFSAPAEDSPLRKKFGRLHALSAVMNLLILADGVALLLISGYMKKP